MVELPCLVSQCAKFHVAGWTWPVSTRVYLESCTWAVAIFTMGQRKEQRLCIKFCTNLEKNATETLTMIQQAKSWVVCRCFNGMPDSRPVANQLAITNTQGDPQAVQLLKHKEFVPTGQTVNSGFHCWVLQGLRENVRRSRPELWREQTRAASPWQRLSIPPPPSRFWWNSKWMSSPAHRTLLIWHRVTSSYFQKWNWSWKDAGLILIKSPGRIAESTWQSDRTVLPGCVPKMKEAVGPVSTCERELLRGWWRPIGFMVSFINFTSVRNILDTMSYYLGVLRTKVTWRYPTNSSENRPKRAIF
jgi:hypothetical protein